jgi:hypothetical protein
MTDAPIQPYDALLEGAHDLDRSYRVVHLGDVVLPTGRTYCCDPFRTGDVRALERTVRPGEYLVSLCVVDLSSWGKRVALAGISFSSERVVRWDAATYRLDGELYSAFAVDAGLACFMDERTAMQFSNRVEAYQAADHARNYYLDILAPEFARNADPAQPHRGGDWNLHYPVEGDPGNVAMFASGLGDATYPAWWGVDETDDVVLLVADFGIL